MACQHLNSVTNVHLGERFRAGSRFKRFLCLALIDVRCFSVPRAYVYPRLKTSDLMHIQTCLIFIAGVWL
jgi:hypothetical protein